LRLRARADISFQPNAQWSGKLRLSTQSTSLNSPHTTFGTADTSKNGDFGLDQAYSLLLSCNVVLHAHSHLSLFGEFEKLRNEKTKTIYIIQLN